MTLQERPATAPRSDLAERLFPGGNEPDPRFTLANERTFLAWIRTSLAFVAAGVALEAFALGDLASWVRKVLAIALIVAGVVGAMGAVMHWWRAENAMRHDRPLPLPAIVPVLGGVAVVGAVGALVLVVAV
ncbi:DUF202 domain-containing protein [Gordonia sp. CPCC 205515]|uniref:YidH family protein n=1 Tax=Gordonia sp. CPCC 205515 TaxID=3140791 RepID=UPI003AF34743